MRHLCAPLPPRLPASPPTGGSLPHSWRVEGCGDAGGGCVKPLRPRGAPPASPAPQINSQPASRALTSSLSLPLPRSPSPPEAIAVPTAHPHAKRLSCYQWCMSVWQPLCPSVRLLFPRSSCLSACLRVCVHEAACPSACLPASQSLSGGRQPGCQPLCQSARLLPRLSVIDGRPHELL